MQIHHPASDVQRQFERSCRIDARACLVQQVKQALRFIGMFGEDDEIRRIVTHSERNQEVRRIEKSISAVMNNRKGELRIYLILSISC